VRCETDHPALDPQPGSIGGPHLVACHFPEAAESFSATSSAVPTAESTTDP
jgi:hypothetical protein